MKEIVTRVQVKALIGSMRILKSALAIKGKLTIPDSVVVNIYDDIYVLLLWRKPRNTDLVAPSIPLSYSRLTHFNLHVVGYGSGLKSHCHNSFFRYTDTQKKLSKFFLVSRAMEEEWHIRKSA